MKSTTSLPPGRLVPWLAVLTMVLPGACQSTDDSLVLARFSLPGVEEGESQGPLRDADGIFDLQAYPLYVSLEVTGPDMEPAQAVWPAQADEFLPGTQEVELVLNVPAGTDRALTAVAFLMDGSETFSFQSQAPTVLELAAGTTTDVDLDLVELDAGTVTGAAPAQALQVWLVDALTMVRLAEVPADAGTFAVAGAPYGRQLLLVWTDGGGTVHLNPDETFVISESDDPLTRDLTR